MQMCFFFLHNTNQLQFYLKNTEIVMDNYVPHQQLDIIKIKSCKHSCKLPKHLASNFVIVSFSTAMLVFVLLFSSALQFFARNNS